MSRAASLLAVAAAALAASAGAAQASLSLPSLGTVTQTTGSLLPGTGDAIDQTTSTLSGTSGGTLTDTTGSLLSGVTTVVDDTTGAIIGVVGDLGAATGTTGVTDPITGAVGDVLGAVTGATSGVTGATGGGATGTTVPGGVVPTGSLDTLLQVLLGVAPASPGAAGASGAASQAAGSVLDGQAPILGVRVLSRLRRAARSGHLRLRVTSDEPAVVALSSLLRPGRAMRVHGHTQRISRRLIRVKPIVLALRRAGSLDVVVKLRRAARRNLGRTRSARMAVRMWASDALRNQATAQLRRTVRR